VTNLIRWPRLPLAGMRPICGRIRRALTSSGWPENGRRRSGAWADERLGVGLFARVPAACGGAGASAGPGGDRRGREVAEGITAVFSDRLSGERTTRPVWNWLALVAVLLLPLDIAARRLVLTRRDWERAWAASFGRLRPQPARPAAQTEQVARLFEAKRRAIITPSDQDDGPSDDGPSDDGPLAETIADPPANPPATTPASSQSARPQQNAPAKPPTPPATGDGSLASRLLDKKRQQPKNDTTQQNP
jgi:hypothetical protein